MIVVVAFAVTAAFVGDALSGDEEITRATESSRANVLKRDRLAGATGPTGRGVTEVVVVRSGTATVDQPRFERRVQVLAAKLRGAGAPGVTTFYETGDDRLVSQDRDATALLVALGRDGEDRVDVALDAVSSTAGGGFSAIMTGEFTRDADFSTLSEEDLLHGELGFGLPAALIVLLVVFGSVVAGVIPIVVAMVAIAVAIALLALVGQAFPMSVFATNMLTGMGLALGIDYSLFVLSRYREERYRGTDESGAMAVVGRTACRAVLFSGIAFTLAMIGLLLVPSTIMRSLAAGAIAAAVVSVAVALTLLPALIAVLGDRVDALRLPLFGRSATRVASPFWSRVVRRVTARPLPGLLLATAVLIALALPVLSLRSGEAGVSTLPDRSASKQGYLALADEFPGETTDPVEVVVDGDVGSPAVRSGIRQLRERLAAESSFGRVEQETNGRADLAVLTVPIRGDAVGERAVDAVRELRRELIPSAFAGSAAAVLVTGTTAESIDESDTMTDWLPFVLTFVLGLTCVLLTVAFRSVVVAVKAIAVNLLSVGAAYGLLVLVFQEGVGNELFGFPTVATIESWVPLFLFAVLFGLSMDYHVFLLTRIRERFLQTGDNTDAITSGVGSTGRIITGAALIIIAVFSGFARGDLVMFQQMGFGVAVALLLDATLVRLVVVPAAMQLLGERNWYLPSWLRWLPDVHVEGTRANTPAARRTVSAWSGRLG